MKRTLILIPMLALAASPAPAGDEFLPIFLGHRDPEYHGFVPHWPQVARARAIYQMCPAQQFAIFEADKLNLEMTTAALYGPAFGRGAAPAAESTPTSTPAGSTSAPPPPPPPSGPATDRTGTPSGPGSDRPARPSAPAAPGAGSGAASAPGSGGGGPTSPGAAAGAPSPR